MGQTLAWENISSVHHVDSSFTFYSGCVIVSKIQNLKGLNGCSVRGSNDSLCFVHYLGHPQFRSVLLGSVQLHLVMKNADAVNLTSCWWLKYPINTLSSLLSALWWWLVISQLFYMAANQMLLLIWMCIFLVCTCTSLPRLAPPSWTVNICL